MGSGEANRNHIRVKRVFQGERWLSLRSLERRGDTDEVLVVISLTLPEGMSHGLDNVRMTMFDRLKSERTKDFLGHIG